MIFPEPKFKVSMTEKRRGVITWHEYSIIMPDKTIISPLMSVTKVGGIISKPLLINWAKKMAINCAREELLKVIQAGQVISIDNLNEIMEFAKGAADRYKDACGDVGTRTHLAIDRWVRGDDPKLEADTTVGFNNFMRWLESSGLKVVKGDTDIASPELKVGGRADVYFEHIKSGALVLGDFKTGKALYNDTTVQIGGYDILTQHTFGIRPAAGVVLRLGKEIPGDIEAKWVNLDEARDSFLSALDLSRQMAKKTLWQEAPAL